jgi:thioester reductase-like protein
LSEYTLLIGSTGLVGRYLIRDLLLAGHQLALVVRSSKKQDYTERLEEILQMWEAEMDHELPRPICFEGDVAHQDLGLSDEAQEWITENCDSVIHNAAVLTFHGADRQGEPWRTNVQGTQYVLDLCDKLNIRRMHYVSTSYVSGIQDDVVLEDELVEGQTFRNDYEHSKFLAETMVRKADFFESTTIYRPSVIAGDSNNGYTNTYHGLYMYLKLISVLVRNQQPDSDGVRHTPINLRMTGEERRNIVPVDWVSAVICQLFDDKEAHGRTYHLTPTDPITPRQIVDAGYKYFNSRGVEFIGVEDRHNVDRAGKMDEDLHDNMTMYESYEVTDPQFDTTNLQQFAGNLPCPTIDEAMLHRFWKYGEEDRWGKRRRPK